MLGRNKGLQDKLSKLSYNLVAHLAGATMQQCNNYGLQPPGKPLP
jgi:hypothetical protein